MDNYITILPEVCINFNHQVKTFCLPEKTPCDNTVIDGILVECGEQWNCNKRCILDTDYFINIPEDGKMILQTNFNTPKNPTQLWGTDIIIQMYNTNNVLISAVHTTFASRWMVGHTGKYGFQNIEIDASLIAQSCFYFKILYDGSEICTQHFKKEECYELVEIQSPYKEYDCWNNYYKVSPFGFTGSSNFAYVNKVWLKGMFKYFGTNTTDDSIVETLRFYPSELIAPYMIKYLSFKILKSKTVLIEGEIYNNKPNTLIPRERSSMFFPILEFEKKGCDDGSASCS